ncbi:MAG: hypothetical protein IJ559_02600 [Prevotella sp.]|nr:hypothetical protein [Prevotella sp.]
MKFKPLRHPLRMFRILRFIWKARKPSTVHDMPAVVDTFWLKSGYEALTFFGTIITHSQKEADYMNRHFDKLKNHEMIHLKQAITTGDSWWQFYRLYLKFWLQGRRIRKRFKNAGYWLNPFEMEAYEHMNDLGYLEQCRNGATEWQRFADMSIDERIRYKRNRLR